jgi:RNA 2',3'-cyclic 3'-phosphodiesterase
VRRELGAAIERLRSVARDVAWVAPGNLHLTVKFLGDVAEEQIDGIRGALEQAAAGLHAFDAELVGLGAFPSVTRPRVVWAGVTEGAGVTIELAGRVDEALTALGFAREGRAFSPHVTLGRVRQPRRDPSLTEALRDAARSQFGRIRVTGASLMRSELSPRGARYSELASVSLGGAVGRSV